MRKSPLQVKYEKKWNIFFLFGLNSRQYIAISQLLIQTKGFSLLEDIKKKFSDEKDTEFKAGLGCFM